MGAGNVTLSPGDLQANVSYDLTFTNVSTSLTIGFRLFDPQGIGRDNPRDGYADGAHSSEFNVTFPSVTLNLSGQWSLRINGGNVSYFNVSSNSVSNNTGSGSATPSCPNPSGNSTACRVIDAGSPQGIILPPGDIVSNVSYDVTLTNFTTGSSGYGYGGSPSMRLVGPDGNPSGNARPAVTDGAHSGRSNTTFPSFTFTMPGTWSLRDETGNTTVTTFNVTGNSTGSSPPATTSIVFAANLTLTAPDGRSDFATFGVARNATPGYDPGLDAVAPPPPPSGPYAQLYFDYPNNSGDQQSLHMTYVPQADEVTYNASAVTVGANGTTTLSWNASEIGRINGSFAVQLIDGPVVVDMRAHSNYSYTKLQNGSDTRNVTVRLIAGPDLNISADALVVTPIVHLNASVSVSGQVWNNGTRSATHVQASLFIDGALVAVNSTVSDSIPSGGVATFGFPAQAQQVVGNHTAQVSVNTTGSEVSLANNAASKDFTVVRYGVSLSPTSPLSQNASLGGNVTYTFDLTNLGSATDTFTLNLSTAPAGWNVSQPSFGGQGLAPGQSVSGTIVVSAPTTLNGLGTTLAPVSLSATSANDPASSETQTMRTTLVINQSLNLRAGWNLVALSAVPSNNSTSALFGPNVDRASLYTWNGVAYVHADHLSVGSGYWVLALAAENDTFSGVPILTAPLNLVQGWNLIGGTAQSVPAPAAFGPDVVTYDGAKYVYGNTIDPGHGYWAHLDTTTSAPTSLGMAFAPLRLTPVGTASTGPEFTLPLTMSVGSVSDFVIIGSKPGATPGYDAGVDSYQAPSPVGGAYALLGVAQAGQGDVLYHRAFQAPDQTQTWALKATTTATSAIATVSWPPFDIAKIDPTYRVELVDGTHHINMRTTSAYAYTNTPGLTRNLQVIVTPLDQGPTCLVALDGQCLLKSPASIGSVFDYLP